MEDRQSLGCLAGSHAAGFRRRGDARRFRLGALRRPLLLGKPSLRGRSLRSGNGRDSLGIGARFLVESGLGLESRQLVALLDLGDAGCFLGDAGCFLGDTGRFCGAARGLLRDTGGFDHPKGFGDPSLSIGDLRLGVGDSCLRGGALCCRAREQCCRSLRGHLRLVSGFRAEQRLRGHPTLILEPSRFGQPSLLGTARDDGEHRFFGGLHSTSRSRGVLRSDPGFVGQPGFSRKPRLLANTSSFGESLHFSRRRGPLRFEPRCFRPPGVLGQPILSGQALCLSCRRGPLGLEASLLGRRRVLGRPGVGVWLCFDGIGAPLALGPNLIGGRRFLDHRGLLGSMRFVGKAIGFAHSGPATGPHLSPSRLPSLLGDAPGFRDGGGPLGIVSNLLGDPHFLSHPGLLRDACFFGHGGLLGDLRLFCDSLGLESALVDTTISVPAEPAPEPGEECRTALRGWMPRTLHGGGLTSLARPRQQQEVEVLSRDEIANRDRPGDVGGDRTDVPRQIRVAERRPNDRFGRLACGQPWTVPMLDAGSLDPASGGFEAVGVGHRQAVPHDQGAATVKPLELGEEPLDFGRVSAERRGPF